MTVLLGLLQMWRKMELEADRLAAKAMSAPGYNPKALARYIDREQASYDDYSPRRLSSLPRRTERLEAINAVIGELPAQTYPPHEGLDKVQEEVRRLTATVSSGNPPTLGK
jgi:predicted Zn-dependent protease